VRRFSGRIHSSAMSFLLATGFWCAKADAQILVHFDLPAQSLAQSLKAIGTATNTDVGFNASQVAGFTAPSLKADLTVDEALTHVLTGTGLRHRHLDDHTILIAAAETSTSDSGEKKPLPTEASESIEQSADSLHIIRVAVDSPSLPSVQTEPSAPDDTKNSESKDSRNTGNQLQEVTVTGSHIRGEAPVGSQLTVYSRDDIDQSGAATVDQFARVMPQNFSNTDSVSNFSSNSNYAAFSSASTNISNSAAFNLHGLGPSATLTLINGHRMAPAGADGSLTDVSQIPLSAIDHIEVLSDGASAIYGTDAVAGVVNIITRKDFDGAETGIRYGRATEGGASEVTASQLLGKAWTTGNALLTYEYDDQGGLDASQRYYIPNQGGPFSLVPESHRNSVLLTGSQNAGADTTITAEAIYSGRTSSSASTYTSSISSILNGYGGDEKQSGLTLSIERALASDWHLSLTGDYSKLRQTWNQDQVTSSAGVAPQTFVQAIDSESQLLGADALANGSIFSITGGPIKAALGVSFRREQFGEDDIEAGTNYPIPTEHRNVSSVFGETAVPIIGDTNELPGVRRLDLSAAVRYDDYSDAGSTTNFKLGAAWQPVTGLTFKSTFGTSFQAPYLSQIYSSVDSYTYDFPDPSSSTGVTDTLYKLGGNPKLAPEKSRAFTLGFDLKPVDLPNFQLSANYFHIDFDDQIQTPPVIDGNIYTSLLAPFIVRNPPLAVVQAAFDNPNFYGDLAGQGPGGVKAIFNAVTANIATTRESGIDLSTAYRLSTEYGQFGVSLNLSHLFRNDFQVVTGGPTDALLNAFGQPPKWKGRGGLTWVQGPFSASAFVNYVNGYDNSLFTPAQTIGAWATGDLYFAFKTRSLASSAALRELTVALNINNVTDKRPPYVQIPAADLPPGENSIPFDASNASPVGRLVTLQLTKGWGRR
jgi:iron complex outermembrane recepter protein